MTAVERAPRILDSDTHVVEPPDLWTSRLPKALVDRGPVVKWDEKRQLEGWFLGDSFMMPVGAPAAAGWPEPSPLFPRKWSDVGDFMWDPAARVARMDADGIEAQILYPNIAQFNSATLTSEGDMALSLACIRAYNDYLTEFIDAAPSRFVAITSIPFWDIDESIIELERCQKAGHRGVIMTQDPRRFGLPALSSRHWDRLWEVLQANQIPVNFHIGSGGAESVFDRPDSEMGIHANAAYNGVGLFMGNASTIAELVCGGVCHRFPSLNFVAVESGVGWVPFHLDLLDWQWLNCGVRGEHPEYDLLPSEYFSRQIFISFWFERTTLQFALDRLGPDNILYETDFPHTTSMTPGPASVAIPPTQYISEVLGHLSPEVQHKVLWQNAANIYHLS
jgi:predicted TIM-barrel fold metal-dependent hydrolase